MTSWGHEQVQKELGTRPTFLSSGQGPSPPPALSKHFLLRENAIGYLDLLSRNEL